LVRKHSRSLESPDLNAWSILTGEYPPQAGGVSDYSGIVASALCAAGDNVIVYAPTLPRPLLSADSGVTVDRVSGHFGARSLAYVGQAVGTSRRRMFVQYVPQAFGCKGMNLTFCLWLLRQSRRHDVWTLFHEVAYPLQLRQPLKHNFLGIVNRVMAMLVARASARIFVTIPAWEAILRPLIPKSRQVEWLPVPATVPTTVNPAARAAVRRSMDVPDDALLIGHFGTYSKFIADTLMAVLPGVLQSPSRHVLLLGRGSTEFAAKLVGSVPAAADRVHAAGGLAPDAVAAHLSACDLMFQPYPDGISTRRTSMMAGLALGVATVSNLGHLSEPLWAGSGAIQLSAGMDASAYRQAIEDILRNALLRQEIAARGRELYQKRFSIENTIAVLRSPPNGRSQGSGRKSVAVSG
jgi:glycosyltransferase involved in cell wall biosynthesis